MCILSLNQHRIRLYLKYITVYVDSREEAGWIWPMDLAFDTCDVAQSQTYLGISQNVREGEEEEEEENLFQF